MRDSFHSTSYDENRKTLFVVVSSSTKTRTSEQGYASHIATIQSVIIFLKNL